MAMTHAWGRGLLALLLASGGLRAGEDGVGTTSANFLKIPAHARPAAMGEAFTAISDDESALLYNPAGIARSSRNQVSATHVEWFQGIGLEHLGGVAALGDLGAAALGVSWLQMDSLVRTQRVANNPSDPLGNYQELGTFKPYDLAIEGAWAWQPLPRWNGGLGVKAISQSIDDKQGWGINADLGLQRTGLWDWLDLGLQIQNLGSSINVGGTGFDQPLTFRAGGAGRFWQRRALISVDAVMPMDNSVIPAVGAEVWVAKPLALRAGWRGGYASQPTAGLGFRFSIFQLDYAWQPYSELGNTQRLTATLLWGQPGASVSPLRPLLGPIGEANWRQGGFLLKPARPDGVTGWGLDVLNGDGAVERHYEGAGLAPAQVAWDGRDSKGQALPDGLYRARLTVESEGDMKAEALSGPVELDSTPPQVSAAFEPLIARPNSQGAVLIPASIHLYAQDKHGVGGWKLEVHDKDDKVFRSFSGEGAFPDPLVWDGTDGRGNYVESGSSYYFYPFAKDTLGNWAKGAPQALIVLMKEIHFDIAADALFEPGKADVRISAYQQLKDVKAMILKHYQEGTIVDIVGHTDNQPTVYSVYKSNQELSLARAKAVVKFMVDLLGMEPGMLNPVGAGDTKPKTTNDTAEGRTANRRVEVVIHAKEYR
jgi:outer membrane protein OmpA-like peptidoglycan-associated protein